APTTPIRLSVSCAVTSCSTVRSCATTLTLSNSINMEGSWLPACGWPHSTCDSDLTIAHRLDQLDCITGFAQLPAAFYPRLAPRPVSNPRLVHANPDVARLIGLDPAVLQTDAFLQVFAGNQPLPGGEPLAAVYSGHQFGVWAGQLGDGRAHLLAEVAGPHGNFELQLKGSGLTPYSRMGDGRAVLRSSV